MSKEVALIENDTDTHPGLVIKDEAESHECVYTGESFESRAYVVLYSPMPDMQAMFDDEASIDEQIDDMAGSPFGVQPFKIVTSKIATAGVISLSNLSEVVDAITTLTDSQHGEPIAPSERIMYHTMAGDIPYKCMVCGHSVKNGARSIGFRSTYQNTGVIHRTCADSFAKALDAVWDYTDDILPANL